MERYETLLRREMGIINAVVALLIATILVVVVLLILDYKNMSSKKERIVSIVIAVFVICACIFFGIYASIDAPKIKKDIDNQDYVVYYGEYEIEYSDKHLTVCYIYNGEERVRLECVGMNPESGIYTGYVVYGRNSLRAVDRYD